MVTDKVYIHYGSNKFSNDEWEPIKNENWIKPHGGLWASAIDAPYGWKDWNETSDYMKCEEENSFKFKLKPEAKILIIDSEKALEQLIPNKTYSMNGYVHGIGSARQYYLNFETLSRRYDAIDFQLSKDHELYWLMYGWDCDSILVMNKDIIEEIN